MRTFFFALLACSGASLSVVGCSAGGTTVPDEAAGPASGAGASTGKGGGASGHGGAHAGTGGTPSAGASQGGSAGVVGIGGSQGGSAASGGSSGSGATAAGGGGATSTGGGGATSTGGGGSTSTGGSTTTGGSAGAGGSCVSPTCASLGKNCGAVTDPVCGGIIDCGTCPSGETCGANGVANVCGTGTTTCTPATCQSLGANCGAVSDGCNGLLQCGNCPSGQSCGVNAPNVCGTGICTPQTCQSLGIGCGPAGDGCGNTLDCGGCAFGTTCGGGGVPGQCGAPTCTPLTCQSAGATCGVIGDGCGGTLSCGSCTAPQICGGGGTPNVCGCTGVCSGIAACPGGTTTTLSGTVYDPAGNNPLYDVLVYVPNTSSPLPPFDDVLSCDQCGATAAGDPLVTTYTKPDGTFTLSNVPVGGSVPLVIQLGRWRRQFTVSVGSACGDNFVADGTLTMPKNQAEGDIPRMALVTGSVDALECVLLKMGLDASEFGNPGTSARVHLFLSDDVGTSGTTTYGEGARIDASTPMQSALFADDGTGKPTIQDYQMALFACPGLPAAKNPTQQAALEAFANAGGRVFATHYSYPWMTNQAYASPQGAGSGPFESVASWHHHSYANGTPDAASVDTVSNPRGPDFLAWLQVVGAYPVSIAQARWDTDGVIGPTQQWLVDETNATPFPLHFTFNTPLGAASSSQCGRGLFSDFHVLNAYNYGLTFPSECDSAPMSAQEKILEFMIFDLGSCVQPYVPVCSPRSCADQGIQCGPAGDGCGNLLDCGACANGTCGGGGQPGQCGSPTCTPLSCADQGIQCGPAGDGCGHALDCGTCTSGVCGGGGKPGVCGSQTCTPQTCTQQGIQCGPAGDGCGNPLDCGTCPPGQTCGLGGPGKCGSPTCTPLGCADQGVQCGPAGDGCGNLIDCGNCPQGAICGLGGPGKCGMPKP